MNKILVIVYVPLLGKSYDVFIPINKKIGTVRNVIVKTINDLSENTINNPEQMRLYSKDDCKLYDNNIYVKNSNIVNGTVLMLL